MTRAKKIVRPTRINSCNSAMSRTDLHARVCTYVEKKRGTHCTRIAGDLFRRSNSEPAAVSFDPVTRSAWVCARDLTKRAEEEEEQEKGVVEEGRERGRAVVVFLLSPCRGWNRYLFLLPAQPSRPYLASTLPCSPSSFEQTAGRPTSQADRPTVCWGDSGGSRGNKSTLLSSPPPPAYCRPTAAATHLRHSRHPLERALALSGISSWHQHDMFDEYIL